MKNLRSVEWLHLRADELKVAASIDPSVVILPTGAVEQHGTHLPEGTDTLTVNQVAIDAAKALQDKLPTLVLPVVSVGVSLHHMQFPGSLTLSPETFRSVIAEITSCVFQHGFKRVLLLNGHGGNNIHLRAISVDIAERWNCVVPVANYWDLMPEGKNYLTEKPKAFPGHAGEFEASLQLYLQEQDVDMNQAKPSYRQAKSSYLANQVFIYRNYMPFTNGTGVYGNPALATKERGEMLYKLAVESLISFIQDFSTWDVEDAGSLFSNANT